MKKHYLWITCCVVLLNICVVYSTHKGVDGTVTILDTDDTYQLTASFDKEKIGKVQHFINKSIKPNGLFESGDDYLDAVTLLHDKTKFYIKAFKGELFISLNKKENSVESYNRIKKMCEGVKDIVEEK
jgi:hypothetical protein